jgi:hypothetical protein
MSRVVELHRGILLGLQAVEYMAAGLAFTGRDLEFVEGKCTSDEGNATVRQCRENAEAALVRTLGHVHLAMEELGDYLSNHDMVEPDDGPATEHAFHTVQRLVGSPEPQDEEG